MYDFLRGQFRLVEPLLVVIDVNGIGFLCRCSLSTSSKVEIGEIGALYVYLHITDGSHTLYGFYDEAERALFRSLIGVPGVGPSTALSILSTFSVGELPAIIGRGDYAELRRVRGIGKKLSEQIVLDLQASMAVAGGDVLGSSIRRDAIAALRALGVSHSVSVSSVDSNLPASAGMGLSEFIRVCLKGT